jgi:polysaccharide biosynthesis/export protein
MLTAYTNNYLIMRKLAANNTMRFSTTLYKILAIVSLAVLVNSCGKVLLLSNNSVMLKTPRGFSFATYNDSLAKANGTYKIGIADFINFTVSTNDGKPILPIATEAGGGVNMQMMMMAPGGAFYVVEPDSTLNFPLLGRLKIAGLTIRECEMMLEEKLKPFYNQPFVQLSVTNRRIFIFTGGNNARVLNLVNERTTLIEALALAGGLPPLSKAFSIKVIRGGLTNPTIYKVDLSTIEGAKLGGDLVLQSNDIVYVDFSQENTKRVIGEILQYLAPVTTTLSLIFIIARL